MNLFVSNKKFDYSYSVKPIIYCYHYVIVKSYIVPFPRTSVLFKILTAINVLVFYLFHIS